MGPAELEDAARAVAGRDGATVAVTRGRGAARAGLSRGARRGTRRRTGRERRGWWSSPGATPRAPLVAIVGKGVVFDSGGLDLKPSAGMRLMKKDMGGAAHALALAQVVMEAELPVRLSVLLPIVENAVSGDAMRPGDVSPPARG